jgi:hypothetical protein
MAWCFEASILLRVLENPKGPMKEKGLLRRPAYLPGLWFVAVEDLIGSKQVQLAMALLKHVDTRKPPG